MEPISNAILEEVKIGWRSGSGSEKKKKNVSEEIQGMRNLNTCIILFPCTHS